MSARRNVRGLWVVGCGLLVLMPILTWGQGAKTEDLPARATYLQALNDFQQGRGSLQNLFTLGRAAAREQLESVIAWDAAMAAGKIPKKRFEPLLPGFHVGTAEALYVFADSNFFLELARRRGDETDRRFFELLHQTFHGSTSRLYVESITDTTACYHLGSREFISLYRDWSRFKAGAPKAYAETASEELQTLEQTLLVATCACGTQEVVDAGFEAFLKTFPKSPIAAQARARLDRIHNHTSDIQFRCGQELNLGQPLPYGVPTPVP
ncbi:hypothetical protein [Hyalangium versicolor]|uniref:hypothetical protein n=1 Tax=Hyalangium versicolor TaxID=2861190 RepID=UPI001CCD3E3C|nr:hypothetical protein [Hyalangium versicolor]